MAEIVRILKTDDITKLQALLQEEITVNYKLPKKHFINPDFFKQSPSILCMAAYLKSVQCVEYLVSNGADLKSKDMLGRDVSHYAAAGGSVEVMEYLSSFEVTWDTCDITFCSPLHYSIIFGNYDAMVWLWCTGHADLSEPGTNNMTPLHLAVSKDNVQIVNFLCSNGCDVNCKSDVDFVFSEAFF